MKQLDNITIRELSTDERNRSWNAISSRLASTPVASPWFNRTRAVSFMFACLVIMTTLGVADTAQPGDTLFALDTGTERAIEYVYPARRVNHAEERLAEFESLVHSTHENDVAMMAETAMLKSASPAADMAMMSSSADDIQKLDPYTEAVIEQTRNELTSLLIDALNTNDQETIDGILKIISAFESRVQELRSL